MFITFLSFSLFFLFCFILETWSLFGEMGKGAANPEDLNLILGIKKWKERTSSTSSALTFTHTEEDECSDPGGLWSYCVAKAGLELLILWPSPEFSDCRWILPYLVVILFFDLSYFVYVSMCTTYVSAVCRSQKTALGSLKLELLMRNMDSCELLCSCWEPNPEPNQHLQEQVRLTA